MSEDPGTTDAGALFKRAIEAELSEIDRRQLRAPASALSQRYRAGGPAGSPGPGQPLELGAYLATRAPATFASVRRVLEEVAFLRPDWVPETLLDLGAGPGTASWAAAHVFGPLGHALLVERDQSMAGIGARLAAGVPGWPATDLDWMAGDVSAAGLPESDLVVAAYVLGELGRQLRSSAVQHWWAASRAELVIVEPGTPAGFERVKEARDVLLSLGAHVTAPCPHDAPCPMTGSDWCHFSVRLERSSLHRDLKAARLGYEDEKYSYLAVSRSPTRSARARLVRSPRPHKGHVRLFTCESGGLFERVVSRRDGDLYRRARAARWGDRLDPD